NSRTPAVSKRPVADDGAAAHHPLMAGLVLARGAVQRGAGVPHYAFAGGPPVRINTGRARGPTIEFLPHRPALFVHPCLQSPRHDRRGISPSGGYPDACARWDARLAAPAFCSAVSGSSPWRRVREKSKLWTARRPSILDLIAAGSKAYAEYISANSVS